MNLKCVRISSQPTAGQALTLSVCVRVCPTQLYSYIAYCFHLFVHPW